MDTDHFPATSASIPSSQEYNTQPTVHPTGAISAAQFPRYSVNLSPDNGLDWDEGTVIDYPVWAMGCAIEVEPDVVLLTYMNAERKQPLLAQLVRVTPEGIVPLARDKSDGLG